MGRRYGYRVTAWVETAKLNQYNVAASRKPVVLVALTSVVVKFPVIVEPSDDSTLLRLWSMCHGRIPASSPLSLRVSLFETALAFLVRPHKNHIPRPTSHLRIVYILDCRPIAKFVAVLIGPSRFPEFKIQSLETEVW